MLNIKNFKTRKINNELVNLKNGQLSTQLEEDTHFLNNCLNWWPDLEDRYIREWINNEEENWWDYVDDDEDDYYDPHPGINDDSELEDDYNKGLGAW
ncbi:MAG: hypothetical protein Q4G05_03415 [Clostridia bacterium]|nr:hypothetical protein [Clostridia bacterium]